MQFPIEQFTAKQQLFIMSYCRSHHATNAAIDAGIKPSNASAQAGRWLANASIKAEIEKRIALKADRYYVEPDRIIREMALMAFSSLEDFVAFTEDNQAIVDFSGVSKDQMRGLTEIVSEELRSRDGKVQGVKTKIKLADKQSALMNLAKLINMLKPEQVEHHGTIEHQHKHAHVVINPRDMSPLQRDKLKAVLLSIESGKDDALEDAEDNEDAGDPETR